MAKIVAAITMSVDGYITGPDDGPGKGLGEGGERLHYWVFGAPWTYETAPHGEPDGEDADYLSAMMARVGAVVIGHTMYEAADHWGDKNPFEVPIFGGGANVIRQGLDAGIVDQLHIIVAPVILGAGKRLFEDFTKSLDLENQGVRQSRYA